jgi:tetratricopeptide (TPR) repeat protein
MKLRQQVFMMMVAALLVGSCAIIPGIVSEAQHEFDEGLALFNGGRYQEAIPRFQRATDLDPNFGRAYLYLGRSYVSLKSWRQAVAPLRTAYRLAPEETKKEVLDILIDTLFAGGLDAYSSADFESAVRYFRELLGLQPTSARGRSEFVKSLVAQGGNSLLKGNLPQAISAYSEAVKISPDSFEAVFGLAKAFFKNGEFSKALDAARSAMRVEPSNRELQSFLQELQKR